MSYANGTTHYNLPQTVGTDKRDWADPNQAFADIDAAIYGAVQDTAQAALDIDALEGRMDTAEQGIRTNAGNIAGLDTRLTTAEGAITSQGAQITDTRQDLEDMICAYNEASATSTHAYAVGDYFIYNDVLYKASQVIAIGDTIVPDTNCSTTNVTTELLANEDLSGDVEQLQTDVGQLQTDIADFKPIVLTSIDATSLTWNAALTTLFSNVTLNYSRRYALRQVTDTLNKYFVAQVISPTKRVFYNNDFSNDSQTNYFYQNCISWIDNSWSFNSGLQTWNYVSQTAGGFSSTSESSSTVGGTLELIEYKM